MVKAGGCYSCHGRTDRPTRHATPAVRLGCTDCHGGDASQIGDPKLGYDDPANKAVMARAHPQPTLPGAWHASSAKPQRRYTLLHKEPPEYIRHRNPTDYHRARQACAALHLEINEASPASLDFPSPPISGGGLSRHGIDPLTPSHIG